MTKYNRYDNNVDNFIGDAFENLFRPLFYDEKFDSMKTDISETDKDFRLDVELPGYDKKDISIDYENQYLTVRAGKEANDEDKENKDCFIRKERSVSCQRSFFVGDIDETKVTASYSNGILTVVIPKVEQQKPEKKGIDIQ